MRRALVALGCAALLAACTTEVPAGDGKLTDRWAPMAEATVPLPPAAACYRSARPGFTQIAYDVMDGGLTVASCAEPHEVETIHLAPITSADISAKPDRPAYDSPESRQIFADCESRAREFLGDDWYNGRLALLASFPPAKHWYAGARYYRCDLLEVITNGQEDVVRRPGSLRGALAGARPLAAGCHDVIEDAAGGVDDLVPVDCAKGHDAEFVGTFPVPGEQFPADRQAQQDIGFPGCETVVVAYLGGTAAGIQVGLIYTGFGDADWGRGHRRLWCYASAPTGTKLLGSVKGIGNARPKLA